jgi:O-antigen ligase
VTRPGLVTADTGQRTSTAGAPALLVALALMATPLLKPHGPAHVTPADVIMAGAILGVVLWAGTTRAELHAPYAVPMAILIGTGIVSAAFSVVPMSGVVALGQDIFLFAWAAAIANLVRSPRDLNLFLSAWAFGAIAWAVLLLAAVFVGIPLIPGASYGVRVQLWFDNPNMAGNYFMVSLFVLMLSRFPRGGFARLCGYVVVGAAVLFTGSVAALGAFAIGASVSLVYRVWWKVDLRSAMAAGALGVALLATLTFITLQLGTITAVDQSSNTLVENSVGRASRSAEGRTNLFAHEFELFQTGPFIGRGPASTKANLARSYGDVVKEAHDDYLATLTERGVIGVVGLLVLVLGVGLRASAVSHEPLSPEYAAVIRNRSAFIGAGVALAISAITHEILHYRHVWAFFGILAGVYLFGLARKRGPGIARRSAMA